LKRSYIFIDNTATSYLGWDKMTEIKSLKDLLDDLAKKPPEKQPPERVVIEPEATGASCGWRRPISGITDSRIIP